MIPNPIVKVLSTLSCHEVRHPFMGGQASVFCGAAEAETFAASRTLLAAELEKERVAEMEADRVYWRPLIRDLESMCLARRHRGDEMDEPPH